MELQAIEKEKEYLEAKKSSKKSSKRSLRSLEEKAMKSIKNYGDKKTGGNTAYSHADESALKLNDIEILEAKGL